MEDVIVPGPQARIRPLKFYTKYVQELDGTSRGVDWCDFAPIGNAKYSVIPEAISRLKKSTDGKWEAIRPAYEAWKKGQEIPLSGLPLAAWAGVTTEQVEVLKLHDVRTVEELRDLTDGQMQRVGLPNIRAIRDAAKAWEAAKDSRKVEAALLEKDAEINLLKEQMADLMALLKPAQPEPMSAEEPAKRGPGRPRSAAA